jgi:hypothetical protein
MSILRRIPAEEVLTAASLIWPDKSVADKIALNAVEIISQTYARDFSFFNGKTAKNLVGGYSSFWVSGTVITSSKGFLQISWELATLP